MRGDGETTDKSLPAISVVAACYDEARGLKEFHRRVTAACKSATSEKYEIILVDDGSHDDTWKEIVTLASSDGHLFGVRLMRNYGHQLAASAGLTVSRGRRVMLIDADLQDPPELLGQMMDLMDEGADVVYGQRRSRSGENWIKLASASFFYLWLSRLTNVPIPKDTGDFRLMNRRVVDILVAMPERGRFIRGLVSWIGGRQVPLLYDRAARNKGKTKYSLLKMMALAADAVTGFSVTPLRVAFALGLLSAVIAALVLAYALLEWMFGNTVSGWTSMMAVICFFSAVQLLVLGIIGEYVGRLFDEAKARPLYVVDSVVVSGRVTSVAIDFSSASPAERQQSLRALAYNVAFRNAALTQPRSE